MRVCCPSALGLTHRLLSVGTDVGRRLNSEHWDPQEINSYRQAIQTMAEDILSLRKHARVLEAENRMLRNHLIQEEMEEEQDNADKTQKLSEGRKGARLSLGSELWDRAVGTFPRCSCYWTWADRSQLGPLHSGKQGIQSCLKPQG